MNYSVAEQFVILILNPEKGRISIDGTHFRYSLTGAILMDFFEGEEIKVEDKRVIPALRINSDAIHTLFSEQISRSSRNRKISYWINRLTRKNRFILSELTKSLEMRGVLRIENKKFLRLIPYKRYWLLKTNERSELIDILRGILLYGKKPAEKELMVISILHAARAHSVLSKERGETKQIRQNCAALLKSEMSSSEIRQTLKEIQSAISSAITAEIVILHGAG